MKIIDRIHGREAISKWSRMFPVLAIFGARQCGKTTLARTMNADPYFDLENPQDAARLNQGRAKQSGIDGYDNTGGCYATTVMRLDPPGSFSRRIWVGISSARRLTWETMPTVLPLARRFLRADITL
jgi:hypothetical protein